MVDYSKPSGIIVYAVTAQVMLVTLTIIVICYASIWVKIRQVSKRVASGTLSANKAKYHKLTKVSWLSSLAKYHWW